MTNSPAAVVTECDLPDAPKKVWKALTVPELLAAWLPDAVDYEVLPAVTLEDALAHGRFKEQAANLRLYRWIATMDKTAPIPSLRDQIPTWAKASALAKDWELNRLAERLDTLAKRG